MTAGCGFAGSYATLFLARMGVGVGEAALSPAAYSMLSDVFPRNRLARAMAVYSIGVPLGAGIARSEEHTSELQSLMRISYAVFCLKKKKTEISTSPTNTTKHNIVLYKAIITQ